jgi:DNA polymerase-1
MPTFHDIRIASGLTNSLSRGSFAEFMERETGYTWDGTAEGKIALMQAYETKTQSEEGKEQREGSRYIFEVESRLLPILAEMEMRGVVLDTMKLAEIGERIRAGIKACEVEIFEVTGEFFNLNSPKQVAEILFGKLGIKPTKKNKTGYSVDTEVLEEIAKEYDVARLIIEHRTLSKLQSTYVESLLKVADKKTRRVHTTYGQLGAATGRMSSNDPNLQNIPTGIGYASEIKSCFIPSEGNIFLVADYSQIEIRVLAWLSQDRSLLDAFEQGEDIHARTAKFLFPDASEISSEQRRIAKTVNFGVIYGITGFGLAKTLGAPPWEATKYIEAFYAKYP